MVATVFTGTPISITPDSNPCSPEAVTRGKFYHAVSGDPSKYIQCDIWGKAYIKACPLGTQWHSDILNCIATGDDDATDATTSQPVTTDGAGGNEYVLYETKHHPIAASTLLDISALSNPCGSAGVRYLPHPQRANRYFVCVNQHPVLASCGYFHVWYQKWGRCAPASESTTTQTTTTTPITTTTQPPTTTIPRTTTTTTATSPKTTTAAASTSAMDSSVCLPENVRYHPYPGDETRYIECRLWLVVSVHVCPPSQVWYQLHQCCLPQTPTTASATISTPPITSPVTTSQMDTTTVEATSTKNFCLGADSRYFPYPPDAAKFIQCDAFGNMFLRFCGATKVWDDTYKTCVGGNIISWPEDRNDTMDDGQGDGQGDVTDGDVTLQVTCPQGYLWIIYTACCRVPVGLVVVHPICLSGFTWSAKLQMCVAERRPDDADVSTPTSTVETLTTPTTTVETPTTTTTLSPTTQQPDGNPCTPTSPLYQPHPYNNLRLLMCVRGAPYVLQCPYTTTTVCVWPPQNYDDTWIQDKLLTV